MITGKTKSGFEFSVNRDDLDNWELFDAICMADEGNIAQIRKVASIILGKEQFTRLIDHLRDENGRARTTDVLSEVMEVFRLCGDEGKNS